MQKHARFNLFYLGAVLVCIAIVVLITINAPKIAIVNSNNEAKAHPSLHNPTHSPDHIMLLNTQYRDEDAFIIAMVKQLVEQHRHEIHRPDVQMQMHDFRRFVIEQYPSNGIALFNMIMQRAFPKYAAEIFALIDNLETYDQWYARTLLDLNDLDPLTKHGTIWQKRHDIFGALADEIWQQEIESDSYKRQTVQQTLATLNSASDITLQERLFILQNTLSELYPDEQGSFRLNKGLISNVYFQLESVQDNLATMTHQARQIAISNSRKQLGFSDDDIEQLEKIDLEKEKRWQNGYQYMSANDQISQNYSGDELNNKLIKLREKFFKHEAPTIAAEEESGFYRYKRPRLFGSN